MMGKRGFTLIELLVVVGIIALLAAVAIPTYVSIFKNKADATATLEPIQASALEVCYQGSCGSFRRFSPEAGTVCYMSMSVGSMSCVKE